MVTQIIANVVFLHHCWISWKYQFNNLQNFLENNQNSLSHFWPILQTLRTSLEKHDT